MLGTALLKLLAERGYQQVVTKTHEELDLTNQQATQAFMAAEKPEGVIICAAMVGGIVGNKTFPAFYWHTNITIQTNLFEAAAQTGAKAVVFFGSSCMYPKAAPQPMAEDQLFAGHIEVTSEAYAAAKIAGVLGCRAYNIQYPKTKFLALVPNSMYGPGDNFDLENSHVLSALLRRFHEAKQNGVQELTLWGSGKPMREFLYAPDVADATLFALENVERFENSHYNIGSGDELSIKGLAETLAQVVGWQGELKWDTDKPDGTFRKLLDSSRFRALGWNRHTPFDQGLAATYQWFKAHIDGKG